MEYEAREKALRDYQSQMQSAENTGFRRGEQAGFQKGEQAGFQKGQQTGFQEGEQAGFQKGQQSGLKRAKRVFQLSAQGKTAAEIADICQMTEREVRDILN